METIYQLTGGATHLYLILLSLIFMALRSAHDALSKQADWIYGETRKNNEGHLYATYNRFHTVGKLPWHIVNWLGRDFFIAMLYVYVYLRGCSGWIILAALAANWLIHDFFYWYISAMREHFQWGQGWPSFPSLFKRIFNPRSKNA